jgi:Fur family zinc uptake transcriptional regulator
MSGHRHSARCTDPTHHVHDAGGFVRAVEQACAARGLRLTALRARVLGLVAGADRPVKAYDLLERMKAASGEPVAPPTVYRALDFLLEQGFIHRLASVNAFVACHHPQVRHSVPFLICDRCHRAVELEDERVTALLEAQARDLGFAPRAQVLEVRGLCSACR